MKTRRPSRQEIETVFIAYLKELERPSFSVDTMNTSTVA
jgi:hypothetical protein